MQHRSSFSQHNSFHTCARMWFYQKVLKIDVPQDMCYAHAGNVIHKCLEIYYNKETSDLDKLKDRFETEWMNKKLQSSKIALKKDEYWLMVINGVNLNINVTSTELKIYFPDCIGYIDVVNTETNELIDWKSSTRRKENEVEYVKQLKLYSWLYFRKFNRLPTKCTVHYLKYTGTKGELSIIPTMADLQVTETWYKNILNEMEKLFDNKQLPNRCKDCSPWCNYTDMCFTNENNLNYIIHRFGNYIQIEGAFTELLHRGIEKKFSYELKQAYHILQKNPHANVNIKFWNRNKKQLPIGFEQGVIKTLNDYAAHKFMDISIGYKDHREFDNTKVEMPSEFLNGIKLRPYQRNAVDEFLNNKISILEIGTGGGKTEIATEIIRHLGIKTLFVVDKIELLRQTKKRLEDSLGIEIGQYGSGEKEFKDVTVATIQTIMKVLEPTKRLRQTGLIAKQEGYQEKKDEYNKEYLDLVLHLRNTKLAILDECHKAAAKSYVKLGRRLTGSEYRLGISGTAFRDDGNDMMIQSVVGDKSYDLSSKVLIDQGWLVKPTIKFIKYPVEKRRLIEMEVEAKIGLINETPNYNNYYTVFISQFKERNNKIKEVVENNKDKKVLVLVKMIMHGELLENSIEGSKYLHGSTNKKLREEMFEDFKSGKLKILIATVSIFAEGIDIPSLDMVINASANVGNVKTIQILGRVLRILQGKKNAHYIDFEDEMRFFKVASMARRKILKEEGHDVMILESV